MTVYQNLFICTPCSIEHNRPVILACKKFNVKKHVEGSGHHAINAAKHMGKVFTGPVQGNIQDKLEEAKLVSDDLKKRQMVVLFHLLHRKRPVVE